MPSQRGWLSWWLGGKHRLTKCCCAGALQWSSKQSKQANVSKSRSVLMPCHFYLFIGLCVSLRPVHWLSNAIYNHSGQYCSIAIATPIKRLKYSITKPMRIQFFEVTAHYCFQSLSQKAIKSTINELRFHQQDLTSVIICSSAEVLKTISWPLLAAWIQWPWLNQQSLVRDLFIITDYFGFAITEFPVCMYLLFVSAIQTSLHFLLIYKQCSEIKWDSRRAFFLL